MKDSEKPYADVHPVDICTKHDIHDHVKYWIQALNPSRVVLLIDEQVNALYPEWSELYTSIPIQAGESCKTHASLFSIIDKLMKMTVDRDAFILGVGGGSLTDLCGFVASVYLRGVRFGYIPTTLLAMTDASLGGKNGINYGGYKNMLGVIRQPEFVLVSPYFVNTLVERDYRSGFAEVIKHACLSGQDFMSFLDENDQTLLKKDQAMLMELLRRSIDVKMKIVREDRYEIGLRRNLNLGHTIGHALEVCHPLTHGESIGIGMVYEAMIGQRLTGTEKEYVNQIETLCIKYGLPVRQIFKVHDVLNKIMADKKRMDQRIRFILPLRPGEVKTVKLPSIQVREVLEWLQKQTS